MPIVPFDKKLVSLDVPGSPSDPGAGLLSETVAKATAQISQTTQQLYANIRHAEAESTVSERIRNESDQTEMWLNKEFLKSQDGYAYDDSGKPLTNPDGTQKSLSEHYREWSDSQYRRSQETLPSPYAQELYRRNMGDKYVSLRNKVWNEEMKKRVSNVDRTRDRILRDEGLRQVETPDMDRLMNLIDEQSRLLKRNEGILWDGNHTFELQKAILRQSPESFFQGMENDIIAMKRLEVEGSVAENSTRPRRIERVREALKALGVYEENGKRVLDPVSEKRLRRGLKPLADMMDPERKAYWADRFNLLNDRVAKTGDHNDWVWQGNQMTTALKSGDLTSSGQPLVTRQSVLSHLARGVQLFKEGALKANQLFETTAEISAMWNASPVMNSWQFYVLNPQEKKAQIEALTKQTSLEVEKLLEKHLPERKSELAIAGAGIKAQIKLHLENIAEQAQREAEADFPKFATKNPVVAKYAAAVDYSNPASVRSQSARSNILAHDRSIERMYQAYTGASQALPPAYLSADQADQVAGVLKGNVNSDIKTAYLLSLHAANRPAFNRKIDQLVQSGKLGAEWYVALSINDDKIFASEMVNAISNPIPDADSIIRAKDSNSSSEKLRTAIYQESQGYVQSLLLKNPNSRITNLELDAVNRTLFNMAVKRIAKDEATPSEAAREVVGSLINRRFSKFYLDPGLFYGGKKAHFPPKVINGKELNDLDLQNLSRELRRYKSFENISAVKPDMHEGFDASKKRLDQYISENIRFRLNSAQDAYTPTYPSDYHIGTDIDMKVDGKTVVLPISDLIKYRSGNDSFWEKSIKKGAQFIHDLKEGAPKSQDKLKKTAKEVLDESNKAKKTEQKIRKSSTLEKLF